MISDNNVVYKNQNFLVLNKPAGILVHGVKNHKSEETVADWLRIHYPETKNVGDKPDERPGIVHRLDKDTSGVLLIARTQNFFEYAKKLFQKHEIQKIYCALVYGKVEKAGVIIAPIGLKPGTTKRSVWGKNMKMVREAITEYEPVKIYIHTFMLPSGREKDEYFTLLRIRPKTGRTHQIRVHLASEGHPIVGDTLYGQKQNIFGLSRQFLHAESIEFVCEEGKRIKIEAELPKDLQRVLHIFINQKIDPSKFSLKN